ncbi:MAG: alpha/beta hydrolase [Bdellovibrionales bacterium]|nr:alpha/beta hydrolase [Bdellovibrionales bacterium]
MLATKNKLVTLLVLVSAIALVVVLLPSQCFAGFKGARVDNRVCGSEGDVKYCYWPGDEGTQEVLVYLHGVGRTQTDWDEDKVTREINERWLKQGVVRPHIVGLSYGRFWWFRDTEYGNELTKALKRVEDRQGIKAERRTLLGDSMGGHNSLRWASREAELFDKLVVICPAIPKTFTKVKEGSGGRWPFNSGVQAVFRRIYPDSRSRESYGVADMFDLNELSTIENILVAATPTDHYGFYSGNLDLKDQLVELKSEDTVTFHKEKVKHCLVSGDVVADFIKSAK